ncbi:2OG-Fe(II) oxygenase [Streptomyces sp. NPDC059076]|uniref:2OG-Fe(II) oxygenase n=1 Tax=unclassified Streptomyces TaxID=2593676 RepID=UPI00369FD4E8
MTMQDTTVRESEATEERSPVGRDAIWRLPVTVCRINNFLGEEASGALLERAITAASGALSPSTIRGSEVVPDFRRSRSDGRFAAPELLAAIDEVREVVERTLGVSCQDTEREYGLNVHNDGDFYQAHQDVGPTEVASRRLLTFVYYLHRTPRRFTGGALRVFDVFLPLHSETSGSWDDRTWRDYEPEHDSIVFFRPTAWHEVRPVSCLSKRHEDSRFAVNGWLCTPASTNHGADATRPETSPVEHNKAESAV